MRLYPIMFRGANMKIKHTFAGTYTPMGDKLDIMFQKATGQQITTLTNYKYCILPILLHLCSHIHQFWSNFYIFI